MDSLQLSFGSVSPRLIRDGLIEEERSAFEGQFREAMTVAAERLDLTDVEKLLRAWRRIVELAEWEGAEQRRRVLRQATSIWRCRDNADLARGRTSRMAGRHGSGACAGHVAPADRTFPLDDGGLDDLANALDVIDQHTASWPDMVACADGPGPCV